MEQQDRILGYFLEEASEHLTTIEQGLRRLPETVKQPSAIRELFRAAHSIKGSAAMLGLRDIQAVSTRFEANFKLLKENPQIQVDNQLQSLFLGSFSFLQAAIEEARTSSDPYRQDPATPDPVGDPVFEELKGYLQQLLASVTADAPEDTASDLDRDPAIEQVFGEYVSRKLAEIVELCQQSDSAATRAQIQQICQKLGKLGENFEYLEWTNLFAACRLAIANPSNSLDRLSAIMSVAIKQAQVLVLAERDRAITLTPDLEAAIAHSDRLIISAVTGSSDTTASLPLTTEPSSTWKLSDLNTTEATTETIDGTPDLLSLGQSVTASVNPSTIPIAVNAAPGSEFDADAMELNEFMNLLSDEMPTEGAWMQDNEFFDLELPTSMKVTETSAETTAANAEANSAESILADPAAELAMAIGSIGEAETAAESSEYDEETFYNPDLGEVDERDLINFWSDVDLGNNQALPLYSELDPIASDNGQLQPDLSLCGDLVEIPVPDFSLDRPMSELFPTPNAADISDTQVLSDDGSVDLNSLLSQTPPEAIEAEDFHPDLELLPIAEGSVPATTAIELQSLSSGSVVNTSSDAHIAVVERGSVELPASAMEGDRSFADRTGGSQVSEAIAWEDLNPSTPTNDGNNAVNNGGDRDLIDWIDNSVAYQDLEDLSDLNLDLFEDPASIDLSSGDDASDAVFNSITMSCDLITNSSDLESSAEIPPLPAPSENIDIHTDLAHADLSPVIGEDPGAIAAGDSPAERLHQLQDLALDADPNVELQSSFSSFVNSDLGELDLSPLTSDNSAVAIDLTPEDADENVSASIELAGEDSSSNLVGSIDNPPEIEPFASDEISDLNLNPLTSEDTLTAVELGDVFVDLDVEFLNINENIVGDLSIGEAEIANLNLEVPAAIDNIEPLAVDFNLDNFEIPNSIDNSDPVATDLNLDNLDIPQSDNNADAVNIGFDNLDIPVSLDNFGSADIDDLDLSAIGTASSDLAIADLDTVATDLNAITVGEEANSLDLGAVDLASPNVEPLSTDFAVPDLNDLSIDLDNLNPTSLNLDNLSIEQSANNLEGLDDLLGAAALGVGGAAAVGGIAALDDLDALIGTPAPAAPAADLNDLDALLSTPVTPTATAPATKAKSLGKPKESRKFDQTMRVSVRHLDNLNNLVGELVVNRNTLEQDQNRMRQFVEKLLSEVQKLNEVGKRMQDLYERSLMENSLIASRQQSKVENSQIASRQQSRAGNSAAISADDINAANSDTSIEYDPLEMDRFTPIHLLSQKMIELTVRVRESTADIEFVVDGSTEVTRTLRQITGQLQEDLNKSRMLPFAQTADRLQRGVRDNGLKYGKQIELTIEGRDTPIDKVILESLAEPLTHMANNAIAHGIEAPEVRLALGKPAEGKITIRALHQGNQTIISISDDGAGIDTARVKQKAIEKGIVTPQQAATMPDKEVYELLFLPSFSTKDQADELSGRGVGMDVVRTSINEIRGTISTESQLGVGTTFTIRLPLALSIAKALIAVNEKNSIAFPMDGIEDTQDVSPEQIQTNSEGQKCIFWRDELMPFKPLSELLEFTRPLSRNNFYSSNDDDSDLVSILILRSDGQFTAVQVDKITGDREIVIKPLQGPAAKPLGIAGATVLGDGRIVPIADVMELIALSKGSLQRHTWTKGTDEVAAPTVEERESSVLIVDDSITVRELLSLTFKRAGYRVEQARDGQEAWDKLRAGLPCDIVFCDIEMPRMDGLEFLSRIQKDAALSKVPVAMLTSRGSDRHRQIASQLGASGYFIKPYLEEALLDAAKRMIKGEVLEIV